MPPFIDLTDRRFGRLTVLRRIGTTSYGQPQWLCRCDCGKETTPMGNSLRSGLTTSCGCLRLETVTEHGETGSPEFTVWQMMIQRCENPKTKSYPRYGGRGITVCDRWRESFAAFLEDMGKRPSAAHTLERGDNDQGYNPENCRWATPLEQGRNKANNHWIEFNGERRTLMEWCRHLGMKKNTLINRLSRGLTVEEALTRPVAHKRRAR
jgi:hypothetical protein